MPSCRSQLYQIWINFLDYLSGICADSLQTWNHFEMVWCGHARMKHQHASSIWKIKALQMDRNSTMGILLIIKTNYLLICCPAMFLPPCLTHGQVISSVVWISALRYVCYTILHCDSSPSLPKHQAQFQSDRGLLFPKSCPNPDVSCAQPPIFPWPPLLLFFGKKKIHTSCGRLKSLCDTLDMERLHGNRCWSPLTFFMGCLSHLLSTS